jgi:hypothetical protein
MKAAQGNRWLRAPLLLLAASGLALSASGCIIDSSNPPIDTDGDGTSDAYDACPTVPGPIANNGCPTGTCTPDLTISWQIFRNNTSQLLTCSQAGGADTVTAQIDGGSFGSNLTSFPAPCPANATSGSFIAQLPASGTYNVSLDLTAGGSLLSTTNVLVQPVDCSGASSTPVAPLYVNF